MKRFILIIITLISVNLLTQARQYEVTGPLGGLSMTLTLPEDFNEEQDKCPMVILMHGIFSSKNIVPVPALARELAEEGIASIRFDFGGHWNSEGRMQDMTIGNEISDALAMWEYAKSLPYITQIGLLGHSQGGVVASMTAGILSERGESPAALVLVAPGSVVQDACRNGKFFGAKFNPSDPPEFVRCFGVMKLGREYILSTQELDIYGTARSYTGPVRIIHGSKDSIVPMSCSEKYVEAYQQPAELIVVEGENHMITRKLKTVVSHAVSFFKQEFSKSAMLQNSSEIISRLEIYDLETRTHSVLKTFPFIIEAPNWTPDGEFLVVNKDGRLFKIAADGSSDLTEIESGNITQCNNDHVITADGSMIGLSSNDPSNTQGYSSFVYIMPFDGGQPRRITPLGPSYLHGISPDGKMAAYCAFRGPDDEADIYVIPVEGGDEVRLTDAPGLDDGPEFSHDGKHIWFNSIRTGSMQIWKMEADGNKQQQMTFDNDVYSWFPHISPDGKNVVYIAYHSGDIAPGDHLPDLNVQLRMIPAEGGHPEVLAELFGGQGTINVNSWSPDSKKFAYVSYSTRVYPIKDNPAPLIMERSLFPDAPDSLMKELGLEDGVPSSVNAFLVKTGGKEVLFDAANGAPGSLLPKHLDSLGVKAEAIDLVFLTHLHGDHIGGLIRNGKAAFPNADIYINKIEFDFWKGKSARFDAILNAYGERIRTFEIGDQLPCGISAVEAYGHTPGHTAYIVGDCIIVGDIMHGVALQMEHPEYCAAYDMDKTTAAVTRKAIMKMAQEMNLKMYGMHFPL